MPPLKSLQVLQSIPLRHHRTLQNSSLKTLQNSSLKTNLFKFLKTTPSSTAAASKSGKQLSPVVSANSESVRNIGIIAHIDAGKTTTTERLLYYSGLTRHLGDIDDGDTVTDFMDQERERGITISSAAISYEWKGFRANLIDTPGHVDFTLEVERALRVLDGAVLVLDGSAGVEAQTLTVWRQASKFSIPCVAFINKLDKTNADLTKTFNSIREKLNIEPLCLQIPLGDHKDFRGVVDLLTLTKLEWKKTASKTLDDGKDFSVSPLSKAGDPQLFDEVLLTRQALVEQVADLDDVLADEFLAVEDALKVRPKALKDALRRITLSRQALPVILGTALRNVGIQPLMDAVNDFLPSPRDIQHAFQKHYKHDQLCALAFKILHDANKGPLTFLRVYSGELTSGSLFNINEETSEKVTKIYTAFANEFTPTVSVPSGSIGVVAGLNITKSGDTLTSSVSVAKAIKKNMLKTSRKDVHLDSEEISDKPKTNDLYVEEADDEAAVEEMIDATLLTPALASIDIPEPVFFCSIEPPSLSAVKHLEVALTRLQREDPSLRVRVDEETNQTILAGMGELHLEIILDRIRREFKVDADLGSMQVVYKEALKPDAPPVVETFVFDRIMNNKRSYVEITLQITPSDQTTHDPKHKPPEMKTNLFWANKLRPELNPFILQKQIDLANHGATAALASGPLLGYPVSGVGVSLVNLITLRGVVPSAISAAASNCVSNALKKMDCILLEPIMDLELAVEAHFLSTVSSDLASRRGIVTDSFHEANLRILRAKVPLSEMLGYAKVVRTITSGTATFSMTLAEFRQMEEEEQRRMVGEVNVRGWR